MLPAWGRRAKTTALSSRLLVHKFTKCIVAVNVRTHCGSSCDSRAVRSSPEPSPHLLPTPLVGARWIWYSAYRRVEDNGDVRIFVGLASEGEDYGVHQQAHSDDR